ncbi:hypothetical protein NDU88_007902 [Pleurodeles waltl]|uniref:Uncharacterized protein n=1 Tax=Pleurodeles waltl TaxID=8319 RepID=A0AAV7QRA7_PLEWA|nr:hypothetical protein NDU88_007902 [Pleurodeles waltl]
MRPRADGGSTGLAAIDPAAVSGSFSEGYLRPEHPPAAPRCGDLRAHGRAPKLTEGLAPCTNAQRGRLSHIATPTARRSPSAVSQNGVRRRM